jgi:hypothetical protein
VVEKIERIDGHLHVRWWSAGPVEPEGERAAVQPDIGEPVVATAAES